jgi:hypothetical protein
MPSRLWSREDIRNILLAIYTAKFPSLAQDDVEGGDASARLYQWGCRVAIQSLLLACGLPLQLLDRPGTRPRPVHPGSPASTQHWWIEDLENVIAAVYRSAMSAPIRNLDQPEVECYRQGFGEVIAGFLEAIGSRADPRRWYKEVQADRQWIHTPDQLAPGQESPPKVIGSAPDEDE